VEMCGNTGRRFLSGQGGAGAWKGKLAERRSATRRSEMSACSACAGDYEDPDRTTWPTEEESEAADGKAASKFPEQIPDRED
jgi:hypothetical protein